MKGSIDKTAKNRLKKVKVRVRLAQIAEKDDLFNDFY